MDYIRRNLKKEFDVFDVEGRYRRHKDREIIGKYRGNITYKYLNGGKRVEAICSPCKSRYDSPKYNEIYSVKIVFEKDENDIITLYQEYVDNKLTYEEQYSYTSDGLLKKETMKRFENGKIQGHTVDVYERNSNGRTRIKTSYLTTNYPKKSIHKYITSSDKYKGQDGYFYKDNQTIVISPDGKEEYRNSSTRFLYDSKGNWTEMTYDKVDRYTKEIIELTVKRKIEYH